jgi:hypothetical protein
MGDLTARLDLYLPGGGSSGSIPDEQADIDKINGNMEILDDIVGTPVVTSGTRPSTPYVGQPIYESDTKRIVVWDGSAWVIPGRSTVAHYVVADFDALAAFSGMIAGDTVTVIEGLVLFSYTGSVWQQMTEAVFTSAAARDTAYAKASAAYRIAGVQAKVTTELFTRVYAGTTWIIYAPAGRVPIVPTAVSGTGVTVDAAGVITVATNVTGLSVDGFTTEFRRYEIEFDFPTTTANLVTTMRLRSGGTDDTSTVYDVQATSGNGSSATVTAGTGAAANNWPVSATAGGRLHTGTIKLSGPAAAVPTLMMLETFVTNNPATAAATTSLTQRGGMHRTASAFTGFSLLFAGGGNTSGSVRVFGVV